MILHIPHSSSAIPENLRNHIVLSDPELEAELLLMTDAFTDELFSLPGTAIMRFPVSRLLVDVERFSDDAEEPMSKVGMGMIYTRTAHGKQLKRILQPREIKNLVAQYYEPHHQALLAEVEKELEWQGKALIVDCHSFPSRPLPCDSDQAIPRPDICIGTDSFHTPDPLIRIADRKIKELGYAVKFNQPYAGSIAPMFFYRKDSRVASIMVEVNRSLYMDEMTGEKNNSFEFIKNQIQTLVSSFMDFTGALR